MRDPVEKKSASRRRFQFRTGLLSEFCAAKNYAVPSSE